MKILRTTLIVLLCIFQALYYASFYLSIHSDGNNSYIMKTLKFREKTQKHIKQITREVVPSLYTSSSSTTTEENPPTTPLNISTPKRQESNIQRKYKFWDVFEVPIRDECLVDVPTVSDVAKEFPEDLEFLNRKESEEYKKILVWNYAYNYGVEFGYGHKPFKKACCKESRCFMTTDTKNLRIEDFDAVLMHFRGLSKAMLPTERSDHQRWIFYDQEASGHSNFYSGVFDNIFNWTMTYRLDSDIYGGYGYVIPKEKLPPSQRKLANFSKSVELTKGKSALAVWTVSNCLTLSSREDFHFALKKYIKVDVYGECGDLKCSKTTKEKCLKMIEKKYKFFFAFENTFCKDYITEKFFDALRYNVVPVVYGLGDYEFMAPPHSYINSLEFDSAEDLANYLLYLDKNDTAYNEYFRWKENYKIIGGEWIAQGMNFCALCEKLHRATPEHKHTYTKLGKWHMDEGMCERLHKLSWQEGKHLRKSSPNLYNFVM